MPWPLIAALTGSAVGLGLGMRRSIAGRRRNTADAQGQPEVNAAAWLIETASSYNRDVAAGPEQQQQLQQHRREQDEPPEEEVWGGGRGDPARQSQPTARAQAHGRWLQRRRLVCFREAGQLVCCRETGGAHGGHGGSIELMQGQTPKGASWLGAAHGVQAGTVSPQVLGWRTCSGGGVVPPCG